MGDSIEVKSSELLRLVDKDAVVEKLLHRI